MDDDEGGMTTEDGRRGPQSAGKDRSQDNPYFPAEMRGMFPPVPDLQPRASGRNRINFPGLQELTMLGDFVSARRSELVRVRYIWVELDPLGFGESWAIWANSVGHFAQCWTTLPNPNSKSAKVARVWPTLARITVLVHVKKLPSNKLRNVAVGEMS